MPKPAVWSLLNWKWVNPSRISWNVVSSRHYLSLEKRHIFMGFKTALRNPKAKENHGTSEKFRQKIVIKTCNKDVPLQMGRFLPINFIQIQRVNIIITEHFVYQLIFRAHFVVLWWECFLLLHLNLHIQQVFWNKTKIAFAKVSDTEQPSDVDPDPDPYWMGIQELSGSVLRIRIRPHM